ncbi:TetR/AcrR family transcriptional regulator [Parvibaculum sp.]|uniref:TetR/AcrR family transcriptional regulator n=1 Tax=Parvibaculum sp. TaxID=2024848 RepID=UPI001AFCFA05|nr:TetR/AcrR family transcriptional regulator [Parvibaculum sp.]MBO6667609.1 TetR/AcrR family transcriptional regulator [Parvibaculum sp.]MBO6693386.1 TetR/AcrR family transcriptional regulator [Parvibaculum sp.]MBO6714160.1 TetR/AcrR family transcriptional regulator [Parvibaculum sp.]
MNSSAAKNQGTPRRRMTVEKRREQIMDAARDIANAEGFHAVTLDRVAEACGITRTLIYQQFGNLSGLLVAMVDREYTRAARDFAEAAKRPPRKGQSRYGAGVAGVLEAVDASPATWRMLLMPSHGGPPELYERLEQARDLTQEYLAAALREAGVNSSNFANPDPELAVRMLLAVSQELVHLRLTKPRVYTINRLVAQAERLIEVMFPH